MTTPEPAFQPAKTTIDGLREGPSWSSAFAKKSLKRIEGATTVEAALAQALTEQVILLHSIRRILIWTLVLIPAILTAIGIILLVLGQPQEPKDCGVYGTLC